MFNVVKTWKHCNMTCVVRHGIFDCPCGYVKLPENHPLYEVNYTEYPDNVSLQVHGGVTFSGKLLDMDGWFVGFDMHILMTLIRITGKKCIRTDAECESETNRLAEQLAEL